MLCGFAFDFRFVFVDACLLKVRITLQKKRLGDQIDTFQLYSIVISCNEELIFIHPVGLYSKRDIAYKNIDFERPNNYLWHFDL